MTASGNGYKNVSIQLPSKYTPSVNMCAIGEADFSAQFSVYVELKTDGKLYLTASYANNDPKAPLKTDARNSNTPLPSL